MDHGSYAVDLVDEGGRIIGQKLRREIVKEHDHYHAVYTLLVTPDNRIVLSRIPERKDLPNVYGGKLGITAGTIRRHNESAKAAAERVIERELYCMDQQPTHLGTGYYDFPDGHGCYASIYYFVHDLPTTYSGQDIAALVPMSSSEVRSTPADFTPTFLILWRMYKDRLPI